MKDTGLIRGSHRRIQKQGNWSEEWSPRKPVSQESRREDSKEKKVNIRSFLAHRRLPPRILWGLQLQPLPHPSLIEHRWSEGLSLPSFAGIISCQLRRQAGSGEDRKRVDSWRLTCESRRERYGFLKIRGGAPDLLCSSSYAKHVTMLFNSRNNTFKSHYNCHFTDKENKA